MSDASTCGAGQCGRHRVGGAQQAVHDPGLAPDLGGEPAAEHGDEAGREGEERAPQEPARRLQAPAPAQPVAEPADRQHDQAHADHDPEGEERDQDRRPVRLGKVGQPDTRARSSCRWR